MCRQEETAPQLSHKAALSYRGSPGLDGGGRATCACRLTACELSCLPVGWEYLRACQPRLHAPPCNPKSPAKQG